MCNSFYYFKIHLYYRVGIVSCLYLRVSWARDRISVSPSADLRKQLSGLDRGYGCGKRQKLWRQSAAARGARVCKSVFVRVG